MAKLTVEIDLDNEVFEPEPGREIARILVYLADIFRDTLVVAGRNPGPPLVVRDINGNTVGQVTIQNGDGWPPGHYVGCPHDL